MSPDTISAEHLAWYWSKVRKSEDGCWVWVGRTKDDYGQIRLHQFGGRQINAHRFAWILEHGPVPDGMVVRHRCEVRECVRPDHLYLLSKSDLYRLNRGWPLKEEA